LVYFSRFGMLHQEKSGNPAEFRRAEAGLKNTKLQQRTTRFGHVAIHALWFHILFFDHFWTDPCLSPFDF
jgi:hypothetical protein